jgi:lactoylglutathione lyase
MAPYITRARLGCAAVSPARMAPIDIAADAALLADVAQAGALLKTRALPPGSKTPDAMKTGVNGKRQINTFDPDGTRVEIMEPSTFDGKPVPPSKAPPPPPLPPYQPLAPAKTAT